MKPIRIFIQRNMGGLINLGPFESKGKGRGARYVLKTSV
jgi:hypothetical protein